jgi:osmotically inducible lipoprotein OsmB
MSRRPSAFLTTFAGLIALAGCGDSEVSRGTSGAAIGAGTGAAVCAVTVIGILPCAVVGGALGAAGGIATAGPDEPGPVAAAAPNAAAATADTAGATSLAPEQPVAAPHPRDTVTAEPLK